MKPRQRLDGGSSRRRASARSLAWGMLFLVATAATAAAAATAAVAVRHPAAHRSLRTSVAGAAVTLLAVAGDGNSGVACGEGAVFYSQPEHRNWWDAAGIDSSLTYTAVVIPEETQRYVMTASDGSVWRSTNHEGSVFQSEARPTTRPLRALCRIANNAMIAVGDDGRILKCPDLTGVNWTIETSPTTETLRAVCWNGLFTVVAVGDHGTILRSNAPGEDWTEIAISEVRDLEAVVYNANGQFLAFGAGGAMWTGQPDARAWAPLESPTLTDLHGGAQVGLATVVVGDGGTIYYSPGGFGSWELAQSPTPNDLHAAAFTGADVLAAGSGATILWSYLGLTWDPTVLPVLESSWGGLKYLYRGGKK
jgi:photosystem II stability/assembly factor-like uncharacterized protein